MRLYHGTSESAWEGIRKEGIKPRGNSGSSNWKKSIESNPDTVYLTSTYPLHFAFNAIKGTSQHFERAVIIEVETDLLEGQLVPDEDALEQVARHSSDGLPSNWSMVKRTRYYRSKVREYADAGLDWEWSLARLGTMGHIGAISPDDFTRVIVFDTKDEKEISFAGMDGSVSVMNFKFMGGFYRNLVNLLFGNELEDTPFGMILPPFHGKVEVLGLTSEGVCQ